MLKLYRSTTLLISQHEWNFWLVGHLILWANHWTSIVLLYTWVRSECQIYILSTLEKFLQSLGIQDELIQYLSILECKAPIIWSHVHVLFLVAYACKVLNQNSPHKIARCKIVSCYQSWHRPHPNSFRIQSCLVVHHDVFHPTFGPAPKQWTVLWGDLVVTLQNLSVIHTYTSRHITLDYSVNLWVLWNAFSLIIPRLYWHLDKRFLLFWMQSSEVDQRAIGYLTGYLQVTDCSEVIYQNVTLETFSVGKRWAEDASSIDAVQVLLDDASFIETVQTLLMNSKSRPLSRDDDDVWKKS